MDDIVGFGDDGVWVSISTVTGFREAEFWLADFGVVSGWRIDQVFKNSQKTENRPQF